MSRRPDPSTLERRARALSMRSQGMALQQIGEALGVTRQRAEQIIGPGIKRPPVQGPKRPRLTAAERGYMVGAGRLGIHPYEYQTHREAGERWCCWHHSWESADLFIKDNRSLGGLGYRCRDGHAEQVKTYQTPEYRQAYYDRHREKVNAYHREYQRKRRAALRQAS